MGFHSFKPLVLGLGLFHLASADTYTTTITIPTGTCSATESSTSTYPEEPLYTAYEAVSPCPVEDGTLFSYDDGSGNVYEIECGVVQLDDVIFSSDLPSLEDCIAACDTWADPYTGDANCEVASYTGENTTVVNGDTCYLSSSQAASKKLLIHRQDVSPGNCAVRVTPEDGESVSTGTSFESQTTATATGSESSTTDETYTTDSTDSYYSSATDASGASSTIAASTGGNSTYIMPSLSASATDSSAPTTISVTVTPVPATSTTTGSTDSTDSPSVTTIPTGTTTDTIVGVTVSTATDAPTITPPVDSSTPVSTIDRRVYILYTRYKQLN